MIRNCPVEPNCVSSKDVGRRHYIPPLRFTGSALKAKRRLLGVLASLKRTRVVTVEDNYIHAESVSAVMRYVDDLEFYINERLGIVHVRSASRKGYADLGVNRRRLEKLRKIFEQRDEIERNQ